MVRGAGGACGNHDGGNASGDARRAGILLTIRSLSLTTYIDRFDHHIVLREEIKEDRRRQRAEAKLEAARRGEEAAAIEERKN